MRGRTPGLAALLGLLMLAQPAAAAPATAELAVQAPLALTGDVGLGADQGLLLLPPLRALPARAALLNITLVRLDLPHDEGRGGGAPGPGPAGLPVDPPPIVPEDPFAALRPQAEPAVRYLEVAEPEALAFSLWEDQPRALLAVGPYDDGALHLQAPRALVREAAPREAGPLPGSFVARPSDTWLAAEAPGAARATGTVRGLFEGVGLVVLNRTSAVQVDTTRGAEGATWVAQLRWTGARIEAPALPGASLLAPRIALALDGAIEAARAWGGVVVEEAEKGAAGRALRAEGTMDGSLAPAGGSVRVRVAGDLAYLTLGGERQDFARAAAAAGGLAALSALAYYGQHLRFLAVPLYARIAPAELLDNDVRRRVHALVGARPGVDVKGTAEAVGVSWSTAAYHLARLEREGLVLSRRAGRSKRFFVNGGEGSASADAIVALQNPTALAIARLVARQPGLMQKEISAALQLPASTVSWHMRRLRALGVVREERRWRRAEYAAGPAWAQLAALHEPGPSAANAPARAAPAAAPGPGQPPAPGLPPAAQGPSAAPG